MSKATLCKNDAVTKAVAIVSTILNVGLSATVVNKPEKNQIAITSVKSCDSVVKTFPEFELDFENGQRFAQMVISYE